MHPPIDVFVVFSFVVFVLVFVLHGLFCTTLFLSTSTLLLCFRYIVILLILLKSCHLLQCVCIHAEFAKSAVESTQKQSCVSLTEYNFFAFCIRYYMLSVYLWIPLVVMFDLWSLPLLFVILAVVDFVCLVKYGDNG